MLQLFTRRKPFPGSFHQEMPDDVRKTLKQNCSVARALLRRHGRVHSLHGGASDTAGES
jgi:hypothetical protein